MSSHSHHVPPQSNVPHLLLLLTPLSFFLNQVSLYSLFPNHLSKNSFFFKPSFFLFQISSIKQAHVDSFIDPSMYRPSTHTPSSFLTPLTYLLYLSLNQVSAEQNRPTFQLSFLFQTIFRSSSSLDKHMRMYGEECCRIRVIIISLELVP